mgnify:CR=1 FL=1
MMENKLMNILEEICGTDEVKKDMDIDLFDSGLLDSLGVIELVLEIEKQFNVKIDPVEINRKDIQTPEKLTSYLENIISMQNSGK